MIMPLHIGTQNSPELYLNYNNQTYAALLDCGASVSGISESLYNLVKYDSPDNKILTFSLSDIILSTAIKGKTIKISKQIFFDFKFNNHLFYVVLLVVPSLSTPLILGNDWLVDNTENLNYNEKVISFPLLNFNIPFTSISVPHISIGSALNAIQLTNYMDFLNSYIPQVNDSLSTTFSDNIALNDIPLNPSQQSQFNNLLQQYSQSFNLVLASINYLLIKLYILDMKPHIVPLLNYF